jgi:predicted Zn-dependent protease
MPQGTTVQDVAASSMQAAGFRQLQGERTSIGGREAFVGLYQGQVEGLGEVTSRAAHILHGDAFYLVAGLVASGQFQRTDVAFLSAIRSFRALSAAEAAGIRPDRIDLYVVRGGDTWAAIAERSGGAISASALAVMNHLSPDSQPRVGTRIKIVVRG